MVPGVAAEEHALPRLGPLDLAALRVGDHERALQHVQHLVGREDRAVGLRVAERRAGRQAEDEHVDELGRGVDPVEHLARGGLAPHVARHVGAPDQRRAVEHRAAARRPAAASARRGVTTRSAGRARARGGAGPPSRARSGAGKSLAISRAHAVGARRLRGEHDLERVVGVLGPRDRLRAGLEALDEVAQAVGPRPRRVGLGVQLPRGACRCATARSPRAPSRRRASAARRACRRARGRASGTVCIVKPVVTTAKRASPKSISTCALSSTWTCIGSPLTSRTGIAAPVIAVTRRAGPKKPHRLVTL